MTILVSLLYLIILALPYLAQWVERMIQQIFKSTFDPAPLLFVVLLMAVYGGVLFLTSCFRYSKEAANLIVHLALIGISVIGFWLPMIRSYLFTYLTAVQIGYFIAMAIYDMTRFMKKTK